MGTINYEALIEKRRGSREEFEQRKQANKLAEIARNLESLHELAKAAANQHAPEAAPAIPASKQEGK